MSRYIFVRRTLRLNLEKKKFSVVSDDLYDVVSNTYEEALNNLIARIDHEEGTEGVLANNGFPEHLNSEQEKAGYLARVILSDLAKDESIRATVFDKGREPYLLPGFYGDSELTTPRMLVTDRIHRQGDLVDYLFYTEGGSYKGELERYLYFGEIIYATEELLPMWFFNREQVVIEAMENEEPYPFTGKLLAFFYGPRRKVSNYPLCLTKLFRTDMGEYLLYIHFYKDDGKALNPRTILRSASSRKIYSRLRYNLEQIYPREEVKEHWPDLEGYLAEVAEVLKIPN